MFLSSQVKGQRLQVGDRRRSPCEKGVEVSLRQSTRQKSCQTSKRSGPHRFSFQANGFGGELIAPQTGSLPHRPLPVGGRDVTISRLRIFNPRHSRLPACATITPTDPLSVAQIVNLLHRWELVRQFASPAKRCSIATLPAEHTIRRSPGCCGYNAGLALSRRRCAPSGQTTPVARNSPRFGPASGWLAGPYVACGCAGFRSACNWASARSGDEHGLA